MFCQKIGYLLCNLEGAIILVQKDRYNTEGFVEAEFERGSRKRVLKNLVNIKSKREMDALEYRFLTEAISDSFDHYDSHHQFTANDLQRLHKNWLGAIYPWAGEYRHVNMSKDGFPFAAAHLVPKLMDKFERSELKKYTPCNFSDEAQIIQALAIVHVEFILIHPFREGNGRLGRLLATIMGAQAGMPPLDFGGITGKKKLEYFAAVRAGLENNYAPMEQVFSAIVSRTKNAYR